MPIPSFDEILEANRDVLERIKEKGDWDMNNRELSDQIIDTVRAIRKIPREQIKNPFEIQIIVVKPKD